MKTFREKLRQSWTYLTLSVAFMLFATMSFAQNMTVKGSISDANGPMIGASVMVDGTQIGTVTELDGSFALPNVPADGTLTFSYVGYKNQSLPIMANKTYNVVLEEDATSLDEVVVVGYEVKKKSVVTGAIGGVDSEDLSKAKATNAVSALSGRVSGVNVITSSNEPGTSPTLVIRGVGTNGNTSPLYVVDGLQMGNLDNINSNDIESMEILKDATSTAIYGSRGANGVVLVTTKKGSKGRTQFTYDGYYGVSQATNLPETMNSEQYSNYIKQTYSNCGLDIPSNMVVTDNGIDTDWLDAICSNAPVQEHNVTFTNGGDKATSLISLGYADREGVIGGDNSRYKRFTARANNTYKFNDFLSAGANLNLSHRNSASIGTYSTNSLVRYAYSMEPNVPVYDAVNGDEQGFGVTNTSSSAAQNPLAYLNSMSDSYNHSTSLDGNAWLEVSPIKGLVFRSSGSATIRNGYNRSYNDPYYHISTTQCEYSTINNSANRTFNWQWENTLIYRKSFKDHNFSLLLGQSALEQHYENFSAGRYYVAEEASTNESYRYLDAGDVTTSTNSGGANAVHSIASYFGRLSYNYKERYMAEAVVRRDGSSNFGPNNKWGTFPGVSVGWNVSNEEFWNVNNFDTLKLRASWGQNGNEAIGEFYYTSTMSSIYNNSFSNNYYYGTAPDSMTNPDVKWETSEQLDLGFDATFFGGKLTATADWYDKTTKDLLFQPTLSNVYGANESPFYNIGQVANRGFEFLVSYRNNVGDLNYSVSANMSTNKTNVDFINNTNGYFDGGKADNYMLTRMEPGHSIGYFRLIKEDGIFQTQEEIDNYKSSNGTVIQPNAKPGDCRWVDYNDDGVINEADRQDCGNPWAKYTFGANVNLDYKGFDFSMQLVAKTGFQVYANVYGEAAVGMSNMPAIWANASTAENPNTSVPRFMLDAYDLNGNWDMNKSTRLYDADYLRISLMEIGYTLPSNVLSKLKMSNFRVYVACDNLATFQKYPFTVSEPGALGSNKTILDTGLDWGAYPLARTTRIGATISF